MNESTAWDTFRRRSPATPPLLMAHRGASDDLPENTLGAFRVALAQGADVLETDLRLTRDDQIVLMHDPTVDRTTDGTGAVGAQTLSELQRLRTRRPLAGTYGDEPPPSLAQLLETTSVPLALELKDNRFANRVDAQRLVDLLARHDALSRCVILSFHLPLLLSVKAIAPQVPIGMITMSNPLPLYPTELVGPAWPLLYVNPLYFWWSRLLGKVACPLDDAPEPRLRWYRALGARVLLTNHPAVTREALAAS